MDQCQLEETFPADRLDHHFHIRGGNWTSREEAIRKLNNFMNQELAPTSALRVRALNHEPDSGVTMVKVGARTTRPRTEFDIQDLRSLCWSIVNPRNRLVVDSLTQSSLIGISPVSVTTQSFWREAVFRTTLDEGRDYLSSIGVIMTTCQYIPSWAFCLAFSVAVGINLAGYQVTPDSNFGATPLTDLSMVYVDRKVQDLLGDDGRSIGSEIIRDLIERVSPSDLSDDEEQNRRTLQHLQRIFDSMEMLRDENVSSQRLREFYDEAMMLAYHATLIIARTFLVSTRFEVLVNIGQRVGNETVESLEALGAVAGVVGAASGVTAVAAPASIGATLSFLAGAGWPTVLAVTNPVSLVAGVAAVSFVAYRRYRRSNDGADEEALFGRERQSLIILACSCRVLNEANMLLACLDYLHIDIVAGAAGRYIREVGISGIRTEWDRFVQRNGTASGLGRAVQVQHFMRSRLQEEEERLRQHWAAVVGDQSTGSESPQDTEAYATDGHSDTYE